MTPPVGVEGVSPLRIAYLIDHLGPGGAEALTAAYLPHLRSLGVRPSVLAFNAHSGGRLIHEIRSQGVPVEVLGIDRMGDPRALSRVLSRLRRERVDLVHAQLELSELIGPAVARILRIPSVVTLHTTTTASQGARARVRALLVGAVLRRLCDRIIAVSDHAARHYVEVDRLPTARISTVYNGIDLGRFRPPASVSDLRAATRRELGVPDDSPLIVTVAVLRQPKGIQHLIRAMPAILREIPGARYLIVGDGEYRAELASLARRTGVGERIVFAGARTDVARMLHASDLFVLPTLTEALPTVIAEAMAAGLAIVATRVGGIPEMVEDGRNGLLIDAGDEAALAMACTRVLADHELSTRLAATGSLVVSERFDLSRQAGRLRELYAELVADARGRRCGSPRLV